MLINDIKNVSSQEDRYISAIKSARAALGWTQPDLAKYSGVSLVTIARIEAGIISPRLSTLGKLKAAIEKAGARIADDHPVRGFTLTVSEEGTLEFARNFKGGKSVGKNSKVEEN